MPYYIRKGAPGCAGWATTHSDGSVMTCHKTKADAIRHMVAVSIATKEKPGGTWGTKKESVLETMIADAAYSDEEISLEEAAGDYNPPVGVQNAAKRALKWIADGKAGDGFTDVGRRRASQLASGGSVSRDTVARMKSYFARHNVDKKATGFNSGEEGYPSPGRVAWDAWGGTAGQAWVNRINLEDKK